MAIIYTYPTTTTLENSDLFVISKMQQEGKPTRSISAANLANFIAPLIPVPGVSQIIAGTNVTISPVIGTGVVTINSNGSVSGTGTTNTLPLWTDGPNGTLGDSIVSESLSSTNWNLTVGVNGGNDLTIDRSLTSDNRQIIRYKNANSGASWAKPYYQLGPSTPFDGANETSTLSLGFEVAADAYKPLLEATGVYEYGGGFADKSYSISLGPVDSIGTKPFNIGQQQTTVTSYVRIRTSTDRSASAPKGLLIDDDLVVDENVKFTQYGTGVSGTAAYNLAVDSSGNVITAPAATDPVTGAGTTNTLPIWSDGPNGILNDSSISQVLDAGNNVKQIDIITTSGQSAKYSFNGAATKFSMYNTVGNDLFLLTGDNTGFYRNNFNVQGTLAVGRTSQAIGATLDVGASADTIPAAWFRNGVVISNNPSGVNVDNTSVVIGAGNNDIVSGSDNCLTVGNNNQILSNSDNAVAFGLGNTISNGAASSFAVGQGNTIDGTGIPGGATVRSQVIGLNNSLTGSFASFIAGGNNTVTTEQNAMVLGFGNTTNGVDNVFAIGESNTLADATANGVFMIGNGITGQDGNMVLGFRNDTASYPATNYALGLGNTKLVLGVGTVNDSNAIIITEGGVTRGGGIAQEPRIVMPSIVNFNFTSDVDAANNGIPVGGIYHNAGEVRIRIV